MADPSYSEEIDIANRELAGVRAAIATLRREAAQVVEEGRAFERRRCRRLCCPVNGPHDRSHPLCVVMPQRWDGDQA